MDGQDSSEGHRGVRGWRDGWTNNIKVKII